VDVHLSRHLPIAEQVVVEVTFFRPRSGHIMEAVAARIMALAESRPDDKVVPISTH
jgi:hypothetical protein